MYKHLGLTAWIALFAFIAVPLVSLAHVGDGSHLHCSDCGAEAHMNPADCISNSSPEDDDDCNDCDGSGELWPGCPECGVIKAPGLVDLIVGGVTDLIPGGSTILNFLYNLAAQSPSEYPPYECPLCRTLVPGSGIHPCFPVYD